MTSLRVSEAFFSLQGEGARAGEPSLFVRLQGCSARHACYASGVRCDTEFDSGAETGLDALAETLKTLGPGCRWIVWTGGEPLDQLVPEIVGHFRGLGYRQALETSGVRPFPRDFRMLFDWIACSPKVAEHVLAKHLGEAGVTVRVGDAPAHEIKVWEAHVHELRYVRHAGQPGVPQPSVRALRYYLSPHSDGQQVNAQNLRHCIELCKEHPGWSLSVQQHKQWVVL